MVLISTPSYSGLITQIVKRLQDDTRLRSVRNDSIMAGANPDRITKWPAVTVSLERVEETWRTFAGKSGQKTATCTVLLTVYERMTHGRNAYEEGLQSVEDTIQTIDDIIQSDMSISGVAYRSETGMKTFTTGSYDNVPVIAGESELTVQVGFTRAS